VCLSLRIICQFHSSTLSSAAIAGQINKKAKDTATAQRLRVSVETLTPAEDFKQRAKATGKEVGLRFEPTVHIDMDLLAPSLRTGAAIFEHIILAGSLWMNQRTILTQIKATIVVFKPLFWPWALTLTMKPLQSLQNALWKSYSSGPRESLDLDWRAIELMAICDRLLEYAATGNGKVLPSALLSRLYVRKALYDTGWPTFTKALDIRDVSDSNPPNIALSDWPLNPEGRPLLCATAAMKYHYNDSVVNVSSRNSLL
jgi:hypothetical protein